MVRMIKLSLFLVISLLYALGSSAFKLDGIIITNDDDTITARVMVNTSPTNRTPSYSKMQYRVKYRGPNDEDLQEITPYDAKEVHLKKGSKWVRLISCHVVKTDGLSTRAFIQIKEEGHYNLYIFYGWHFYPGNTGDVSEIMPLYNGIRGHWAIQKEGGYAIMLPMSWEYENELAGYFDDCAEIQKKIDAGKLSKWRIAKTVRQYNSGCI